MDETPTWPWTSPAAWSVCSAASSETPCTVPTSSAWRRWGWGAVLLASVGWGCAATGPNTKNSSRNRDDGDGPRPSKTIGDFLNQPRPS